MSKASHLDSTATGETQPRRIFGTILDQLPSWLPWVLLRLLSGMGVVLALSFIVFAATQALPSDPARQILGPEADEAAIVLLRTQLGLDRPLPIQYLDWFSRVARGDFGVSLDSNVPVSELLARRLGNTLTLLLCVVALSLPLALTLGIVLALWRDSRPARFFITLLILVKATPDFIIALGLMFVFALNLQWLPAVSLMDPDRSPLAQAEFLVLPALTITLGSLPYLIRLVRTAMIETLESEYVTQARLRGIPEQALIFSHALPNALIPVIYGVALMLSVMVGGALIAEVVFAYPGIGSALNSAVQMRDLPLIQGAVLIITLSVVLINLLADFLTVLLTPRLRTAESKVLNFWRRSYRRAVQPDSSRGW
ncbi:MAG: ABC transporter permease [Zoogloeaceae bacterium]|jgi:peptide/nickel transport system permease protein|nr:ABC transporter permease [Zoogloeaceae bacterium]